MFSIYSNQQILPDQKWQLFWPLYLPLSPLNFWLFFQSEVLTPQYFHYHNFTQNPNSDSAIPIIKSTSESIEEQIQEAAQDTDTELMKEFQTFKSQLGALASRLDFMY